MKNNKSFTLLELLIASSIFVIVMVGIYSAFQTGIFGYRDIEQNISLHQDARQIMERINSDLRNSFSYAKDKSGFTGDNSSLSFFTLADTYKEDKIVPDFAVVSYFIKEARLMRLCRKGLESLKGNSEIQAEEMSGDIEGITFKFGYLGASAKSIDFVDSWGSSDEQKKSLPLMVEVDLTVKNKLAKSFKRRIFLPLSLLK